MDVLNPYAKVARAASTKLNEERRAKPLKKKISKDKIKGSKNYFKKI